MTGASSKSQKFLPYGRQTISEEDIAAVRSVLESDWLTQGPTIERFEAELTRYLGAREVVACATGTAALHLAMLALDLGPEDWIITSANTFLADANAARLAGGEVIFADIDPQTGCVTPETISAALERNQGKRIRALVPVHFAGQPIRMTELAEIARKHNLALIDDACHALGAQYEDGNRTIKVGASDGRTMSIFSFHPVKHVAMGEGGALAVDDPLLADRLRLLRNHGMSKTKFQNANLAFGPDKQVNPWYYEMSEIGLNYRLTDIQAALGISQLARIEESVARRNQIADRYDLLFSERFAPEKLHPLERPSGARHAYHLYVLQIDFAGIGRNRGEVMRRLRDRGIGTQVHYIPVPLQPYYRHRYGFEPSHFPGVLRYYEAALSIPMYPALSDEDQNRVVDELERALKG